jgi:hypothetical protein
MKKLIVAAAAALAMSEFNKLSEDMTVEIIENMKKAVSVKKWVKAKI